MKITISVQDDGVDIGLEVGESVYPTTHYQSKRAAASRVLQLLDIGPVAPQTHPENVCIGEIEYEQSPGDQQP